MCATVQITGNFSQVTKVSLVGCAHPVGAPMWGASIREVYPVLVPIHMEMVAGWAELCTVMVITAVPWTGSHQARGQPPDSFDKHFVPACSQMMC